MSKALRLLVLGFKRTPTWSTHALSPGKLGQLVLL